VIALCLSAFFSAWMLHAYNLSWLAEHHPERVRDGVLAVSIDDSYYISQAENFRAGRGFRASIQNSGLPAFWQGEGTFTRRTPGYPLWYWAITGLGPSWGHRILAWLQLGLAAGCAGFFFILLRREARRVAPSLAEPLLVRVSWLVSLLGALLPLWNTYARFTLTEAITPFLSLLLLWLCQRAREEERGKAWRYGLASLVLGISTLTRPNNAILGLILAGFCGADIDAARRGALRLTLRRAVWWLLWCGLPAGALLGAWTARNYSITGDIIPLEVAYHPESLDRMKPEFRGFWSLTTAWGQDGGHMNRVQYPLWLETLQGRGSEAQISAVLDDWPEALKHSVGEERLRAVLLRYQREIARQAPYFARQEAMPAEYSAEQLAIEREFLAIRADFCAKESFLCRVEAPARYLSRLVFHSNTSNLESFSAPGAGLGVKALKAASLLVHAGSYLLLLLSWVWLRKRREFFAYWLVPVLGVLVFALVFRVVEQRYMLPFLPLVLLGACGALFALGERARRLFAAHPQDADKEARQDGLKA
jgi:hypothetical protein